MSGQYKLETVLPGCFENLGEGPHWDPASHRLLCVDILKGGVLRWDPATNDLSKINLDGMVGFVIPRSKGGYVVGLNKTIAQLDFESKEVKTLAAVDEGLQTIFNDAKCDASGRLWAGTLGFDPAAMKPVLGLGSMYSLSRDHKVKTHLTKLGITNGLDWTGDSSLMYYIDTPTRKVVAFDFDLNNGILSNRRDAVQTGDNGGPDGMCVDEEGKLWVAFYGGSRVCRFDPETGKTLQTIMLPTTNVTSCCFGGKNLDELYITSGRPNADAELTSKEPLAGSLFRVTGLGVKGKVANNFEG